MAGALRNRTWAARRIVSALAAAAALMAAAGAAPAAETASLSDYRWTGFSAGFFGGWTWNGPAADVLSSVWLNAPALAPTEPRDDVDPSFGVQGGWDTQFGPVLFLGGGVSFGTMNVDATVRDVADPLAVTVEREPKAAFSGSAFGDATLRAGAGFDRLLLFGRAGVALMRAEGAEVDACGASDCASLSLDGRDARLLRGVTAGGGVEYLFGEHASTAVEYRFYQFEPLRVTGTTATGQNFRRDLWPDAVHMLRASFNYRF